MECIFSWIFKKRELRGNIYGSKNPMFTAHTFWEQVQKMGRGSTVVELSSAYPNVTSCKMLCLVSPKRHGLGITPLLSDPQLPNGCGWLGLFVPSTQNDSYSRKTEGKAGILGLSSYASQTKFIALFLSLLSKSKRNSFSLSESININIHVHFYD